MTESIRPRRALNCVNQYDDGVLQPRDPTATIEWDEALERLGAAHTGWLTTSTAAGRPHTRPVLSVVVDGALATSSSRVARKFDALASARTCSLAASADGLDVVWTARPRLVDDRRPLEEVASAYRSKYGWDVTAVDTGLDAPYGAPCAGPPPYLVFRLDPITVHALGTDERYAHRSTRFEFDAVGGHADVDVVPGVDDVDGDAQVVVAGSLHLAAASRDAYLETCEPVVRLARGTDGCLDFSVGPDLLDPGRVNVFERWRDRTSLERFRADGPSDEQSDLLLDVRIEELDVPR